jgi:dihydrofolate synthase/folylpolyglutamate synthase
LAEAGIATVDADARRRGYATAVWPGRLELLDLGEGRAVLLDGAHNPAGAAALAQALDDLLPHLDPGPFTLVVASMADKDVDGVVAALATAAAIQGATVIATSVDAPRAMPADDLAERWRRVDGPATVTAAPDPIAALDLALARPGTTVVAGSLYLVGAVRAHLVDDPELRDPDAGATAR